MDYLGVGDYRLMMKPIRDVAGRKGVQAWKGDPDCPSLTVNTNSQEEAILTFKLPPKSVSVHPGPSNGVAVAWESPIDGNVRITGKLIDADPAGGDGIAWIIDHRQSAGQPELASGEFPHAGPHELT